MVFDCQAHAAGLSPYVLNELCPWGLSFPKLLSALDRLPHTETVCAYQTVMLAKRHVKSAEGLGAYSQLNAQHSTQTVRVGQV